MNERGRTGLVATLVGIIRRAVDLVVQIVDWIVSITIRRPPGRCAEIDDLPEGYHANPAQCNTVNVTALDPGGGLMVYPGRSQPETFVKRQAGIKGFDAASRLEKRFPPRRGSSSVQLISVSRRASRQSQEGRWQESK